VLTFAIEAEVESYQKLKDAGCQIVGPGELDMAGFRSAVRPIYRREIALVDDRVRRAFEG
jgi:TRAP-type C4-dicarboxylate transport system substrate-binding protein